MFECSSTIQEIQQRQKRLQYRSDWLKAILDETERELRLLVPVEERAEEDEPETVLSEAEILEFVNNLSSVLLNLEQEAKTPSEIQQRREQLEYQKLALYSLWKETQREIELIGEIIAEAEKNEEGEKAELSS
ncbi:MAG: hypothetical protein SAJ37_02610 [Oscillatoria sp. PMC 1068.18]|nr:hypothetical protein [Oscillatoria sp. PMC 1076.18]MEC4987614.1 hypothetical protein [Oscillatoria sp. PMC 1068.18]